MPNKTTNHRFQVIQGGKKTPPTPLTPYQIFERGIVESLAPVGSVETEFANSIAQGHWRMNQIREAEFNLFASASSHPDPAAALARIFHQYSAELASTALYETRLQNVIESNYKHLLKLQKARKTREAAARAEAVSILGQAILDGATPSPHSSVEQNGFVFSVADLLTEITRAQLLRDRAGKRAEKPKVS